MSAAGKAKGTAYERQVADLFRSSGVFPHAERAPRWGSKDRGDLTGVLPYCVELKATKALDLAGFIKEAQVEAVHAGADFPVVIWKRRMKPVEQSFVVMELSDWLEMARNALSD